MNKNYNGFNICISSGGLIKTHNQINLTTFYNYFPKPIIININPLSAYFFIQTLIKSFTGIFNSIKNGFKNIKDALKKLFKNIKDALSKIANQIINFLKDKIKKFFDIIKNIIKKFIKPIIKFLKFIFITLPKLIYKILKTAVLIIWYVVKKIWGFIKKTYIFLKHLIQKVVYCFKNVKNVLLNIRATFAIAKHLYLYAKGIHPKMRIFRGFAVNGAHVYGTANTRFIKKGEDIIRISKNGISYLKLQGGKLIVLGKTFILHTGDVVSLIATKKGRAITKAKLALEAANLFNKYEFFIDTCHLNFDYIRPIKKAIKPKPSSIRGIKSISKIITKLFNAVKGGGKIVTKVFIKMLPKALMLGITSGSGGFGAAAGIIADRILSMVLGFLFEGFDLCGIGSNYFELIKILFNQGRYWDALLAGLEFSWDWATWWYPAATIIDLVKNHKQYWDEIKTLYDYLAYIFDGRVPYTDKSVDDAKRVDDAIIENGVLYPLNNKDDLRNNAGKINFIRQIHQHNYQLELQLLYMRFKSHIAQENMSMLILKAIKKILTYRPTLLNKYDELDDIDMLILDQIHERFKNHATFNTIIHYTYSKEWYAVRYEEITNDPKNPTWYNITLNYDYNYITNITNCKNKFIETVELTKCEQQRKLKLQQDKIEQIEAWEQQKQRWKDMGWDID